MQKHKGAFLTFSCQIWFDSSALAFTGFCAIVLLFKLDIISWLRTSWPLPEMVLSLVVCHQTTEQIASSHSNPDPAGHSNVFLTLLKQIHKAKGITLLWPHYYLCSVLLGDPVHHCGLNFSQSISFGLQLKVVNTLLFRGSLQRRVTITLVPKQAAFSPKKFWASEQLKIF